tara:strand:+ start:2846 stop:4624 length:1779 start_codon:yes stop_codon:yes gene_type:complete
MASSSEELAQRRQKLEEDKLALEEEELRVKRLRLAKEREHLEPSASILRLNVGGQTFDTTRDTLLSSGSAFFMRLLDEGSVVQGAMRDGDGRLFIDRSPEGFRHCLEWMRGNMDVLLLDKASQLMLLNEALYYDLPRLIQELQPTEAELLRRKSFYDPTNLPEEEQAARVKAAAIREALSQGQDGAAAQAEAALISVFTPGRPVEGQPAVNALRYMGDEFLTGAPILFGADAVASRKVLSEMSCVDMAGFRARLNLFAGPLFQGLDMTNLVIAGGAVLEALTLKDLPGDPETVEGIPEATARDGSADIDLFVVADDEQQARAAFNRVFAHLKRNLGRTEHHSLLVLRTSMAVSFYAAHPNRTIQVILRRYTCAADVIFNFDVDACQLAYDGRRVVATPAAHRAFRTGLNIADPERSSPAYEKRLAKYSLRGFAVAVPGLELSRVSKRFTSGCFTWVDNSLQRVSLSFSGGDMPAYSVGTEPIVGLSKLLVLSAVRTTHRERARRTAHNFEYHETAPDDIQGTYIINLSQLTAYGRRTGHSKEVWRKPTPPTPPPVQVLAHRLRKASHLPRFTRNWWSLLTPALAPCTITGRT